MDTRSIEPSEEQQIGVVLAVCCRDDYCIGAAVNRCPCCELTYCDDHTHESGLCLDCEAWCERNGEA